MYPFLNFGGGVQVPSYFFVISLSICLGLYWLHSRTRWSQVLHHQVFSLAMVSMIAGFIGGRLFHVFYEAPSYYAENPYQIFQFWKGGFVFYGGSFFAVISCWIFSKIKNFKIQPAHLDAIILPLALIIGLSRWGCFFAGCCYGTHCDLPWAVTFTSVGIEAPTGVPLHPTQLYASFAEFFALGVGLVMESWKSKDPRRHGLRFFPIYLMIHGLGRLFMEFFRADDRGSFIGPLSVSSWIAACLTVLGLVLTVQNLKQNCPFLKE
jgi:phosphatidylglycerol---prolipoprotein diacylglyceryl transferase